MAWYDELDPQSAAYDIASDPRSPIRVLAGPGTGKSTALKRRVARLLEEGANPRRILAVTFTRTAARELLNDLRSLAVPGCENVAARTLHSLCFELLKGQGVMGAMDRTPRILMDFEMPLLLRDLTDSRYGNMDSRRKRLSAYEASWARLQHEEPGSPRDQIDLSFEADLENWLLFHECMLLGELVPQALNYLRNNPLSPVRTQFQHVLVDEYQDLNRADQVIIDLLAQSADLVVVGDDKQAIFSSLRYASREGIRDFVRRHEGAVSKTMTECRRCPCRIVRTANHFIARADGHADHPLMERECNGEGEIHVLQWESAEQEAAGLAKLIDLYIRSERVSAGEVLVLSPWRMTGYRIRDNLIDLGRHACSYFAEEALDSSPARECFEILTLLVYPEDRVALRHLIGIGSRDNRSPAYSRLRAHCETSGLSPWEALAALSCGELSLPHIGGLAKQFSSIRDRLTLLAGVGLETFIDGWLDGVDDEADLRHLAQEALREPSVSRILNEWIPGPVQDNPLFVKAVHDELRTRISQPELPSDDSVIKVMSLHKSKGLTAELVVVAGCIDGWIPRVDDRLVPAEQQEHLQEQTRLFYVALTRTTKRLILSSAIHMSVGEAKRSYARLLSTRGRTVTVQGSRFLGQLGPDCPRGNPGTQLLAKLENGSQ